MARKKSAPVDGGNWLDTYADMVTLLLTFFVMLYASSSINEEKWQLILQAFESFGTHMNDVVTSEQSDVTSAGDQLPLPTDSEMSEGLPQTFDQLYQYLQQYIGDNNLQGSVELEKGAANVYLRFRDNIFFGGDSDVLLDEGEQVLTGLSTGIKNVESLIKLIRINGHTADSPYSSVNDRLLSAGRANAVLRYLENMNIVPPQKLVESAYGMYRPVATNDTEENRRLNRRVEIVIMRNDVNYSDPNVIYDLLAAELGDQFTDKDTFISQLEESDTSSDTPSDPAATTPESGAQDSTDSTQ